MLACLSRLARRAPQRESCLPGRRAPLDENLSGRGRIRRRRHRDRDRRSNGEKKAPCRVPPQIEKWVYLPVLVLQKRRPAAAKKSATSFLDYVYSPSIKPPGAGMCPRALMLRGLHVNKERDRKKKVLD